MSIYWDLKESELLSTATSALCLWHAVCCQNATEMSQMHVGMFTVAPPHAHTVHTHLACEFTDGCLCFLHSFLSGGVTLVLAESRTYHPHITVSFLLFYTPGTLLICSATIGTCIVGEAFLGTFCESLVSHINWWPYVQQLLHMQMHAVLLDACLWTLEQLLLLPSNISQ